MRSDFRFCPVCGGSLESRSLRGGDPARAMTVSEALLQRGVFVQGIRPPTVPRGTARLRLSLMSSHTEAQIDTALRALAAVRADLVSGDELGVEV